MYRIELTKGAIKQLNKLPNNIKERIDAKILDLAIEPRPNGVKKIKGDENSYRIRVGYYRIIYEIYDDILLITVVRVGHRSKIYKEET
ncbi:type II toxin-antitoxin system RelE/ParE family toxin [Nostoc sp. FACHB-152]|uniref:type II toxin-antitoxin system RelE family toxin n=1 Tax=unclassified Nostoc TaxID=2593658 RepID=UPI0016826395|nr:MULTISPECIES: type II toxin-antitoxin system RelE/ParE family toxin [unclassified Nostoc]MBD2449446.1 type II toxin-antitoxin system RelE/ParE family toxin [Nostoc sp. FACHB-152]MBD2470789.1 type II toxin-antitoxin system RelE/ParE family toxin [Nostoc sp. FACHB-145]